MSDESKPTRRIILPTKQTAQQSSVAIIPDAPQLLTDALSIIAMEIVNMKAKTGPGQSLRPEEARILTGYLKCLADISRELRERAADPSQLSTEQIVELLKQASALPKEQIKADEEPKHGT